MRAAVWKGPGRLDLEDRPDPGCPSDGALVRVLACGISGGDVRLFFEGEPDITPPWTFGHELSGELVEVGAEARARGFELEPGARVHVISTLTCGRCGYCRRGLEHVCPNGLRMGRQVQGAFAELVALPAMALRNVFEIPDGLDPVHATFADPLSDAICGHKDLDVGLDQTVVVVGAGPVGVAHAALARSQGARVRLHEAHAERLDLARAVLGEERMNYVDVSREPAVESARAATGGLGADRVIVATAAVRANEEAIEMAAPLGRVLFFSDLPPGIEHISFPLDFQYAREIAVLGSYASRYEDQLRALSMLAANEGNLCGVISEVVDLEGLPAACERIRDGRVLKVVVTP